MSLGPRRSSGGSKRWPPSRGEEKRLEKLSDVSKEAKDRQLLPRLAVADKPEVPEQEKEAISTH